jgi:hypothetical protein
MVNAGGKTYGKGYQDGAPAWEILLDPPEPCMRFHTRFRSLPRLRFKALARSRNGSTGEDRLPSLARIRVMRASAPQYFKAVSSVSTASLRRSAET